VEASIGHIPGVIGFAGNAKGFDTSIIYLADVTYVEHARNQVANLTKPLLLPCISAEFLNRLLGSKSIESVYVRHIFSCLAFPG
jgi:hypothetical protein